MITNRIIICLQMNIIIQMVEKLIAIDDACAESCRMKRVGHHCTRLQILQVL